MQTPMNYQPNPRSQPMQPGMMMGNQPMQPMHNDPRRDPRVPISQPQQLQPPHHLAPPAHYPGMNNQPPPASLNPQYGSQQPYLPPQTTQQPHPMQHMQHMTQAQQQMRMDQNERQNQEAYHENYEPQSYPYQQRPPESSDPEAQYGQGQEYWPQGYEGYEEGYPGYEQGQQFENDGKLWEEKFYEIYTKFQFFVEKFQVIYEEIFIIEEQFESVSTEEEWNQLRGRYTEMIDRFNQIREEIINILQNNRQLPVRNQQEQRGDETGKQTEEKNLWEHRYYEILQQHEMLAQEYNEIKTQLDTKTKKPPTNIDPDLHREGEKVTELENALNSLNSEYKELEESYNKLSEAYSNAIVQIQQNNHDEVGTPQDEAMIRLESDLREAQSRVQYLENELAQKNSREGWDHQVTNQQVQAYEEKLQLAQNQRNSLINNINSLHAELEKYDEEVNRQQQIIQEQGSNLEGLGHDYNFLQQKVQEYEQSQNRLQETLDMLELREKELEQLRQLLNEKQNQIQSYTHHHDVFLVQNKDLQATVQHLKQKNQQNKKTIYQLEKQNSQLSQQVGQSSRENQQHHQKIDEAMASLHDKTRKVKILQEELDDAISKHERKMIEKDTIIKQIKSFSEEEEEKLQKKISDKQHNIKILQERIRSLQNQLANRNLEISRFRPQVPASNSEEIKQLNDIVDKKNTEIQQLRREKENKNIQLWEQQQNYQSLQMELNNKTFQLNNLKREVYDLHSYQVEIDSLNSTIKKKNQQINELRLSGIQKQQLKFNIESLERQKIRINQYLKQKNRQCENKDTTISNLQQKVSSFLNTQNISLPTNKYTQQVLIENENMAKHKQSEIKKLKYELELAQTTIITHEKTIKDLQAKNETHQRSYYTLKEDLNTKVNRYEQEIKNHAKQIKESKKIRYQNSNMIESLKIKIMSLQKSQEDGMSLFDREIQGYKQKVSLLQQQNIQLNIDLELSKNQLSQLNGVNKELRMKLAQNQERFEEKASQLEEVKSKSSQKQIDNVKNYQQKITFLDSELKLSGVRIRNMEDEIDSLNKRIKNTELEKEKYKQRLYTETSGDRNYDFDMRQFSEYNEVLGVSEVNNRPRFKIKDVEANQVFQRKVIYQLKKQNQFLRRELSGLGISQISLQRPEHQINSEQTQQQIPIPTIPTDRNNDMEDMIEYYKDKNKELEALNEELLKFNKQLKEKVAILGAKTSSQSSIEFYKTQTTNLENEVGAQQTRIRKLVAENRILKQQNEQLEKQIEELKSASSFANEKTNDHNRLIRNHEMNITELNSKITLQNSEIATLKGHIQKYARERQKLQLALKKTEDMRRANKELEQQVQKQQSKMNYQEKQIDQLKRINQNNDYEELNDRYTEVTAENQIMQKKLEQLARQSDKKNQEKFPIQYFRSLLLQTQTLVEEISLKDQREEQVQKQIKSNLHQGLTSLSEIVT